MVAVKYTNKKTHIERSVFFAALHKVFGEPDDKLSTLVN